MTEAPHWALLWVWASRLLPSEPPTATHIQPSPPLPPLWVAPRGLQSLRRRRPSWLRSGGGSGGGCAGTATRGRLLSVSFSRWNGGAATARFMVRRRNLKEWWWIRQGTTAGLCFPTGGFFLRRALTTEHRRREVFAVDSQFYSPGSVAAALDKIEFEFWFFPLFFFLNKLKRKKWLIIFFKNRLLLLQFLYVVIHMQTFTFYSYLDNTIFKSSLNK